MDRLLRIGDGGAIVALRRWNAKHVMTLLLYIHHVTG